MTDLIKTVRGLDQSGPGQDGETLDLLWKQMTAAADGKFHAVEESSLRWLLKSMNGSAAAAETMRRYPLTWKLLGCVMQRIPLFSLAKSLADRKFIQILQQTLKEISQPKDEPASKKSSKRKRSSHQSFSLAGLKTADGCLETGAAIFEALNCLLNRINASTMLDSPHDQIGTEHLKSLFGTPAQDMVLLTAPLLQVCNLLLDARQLEECEGSEGWIETISSIWSLHLQANDDVTVVAEQVFPPVAMVMSKLGELSDETVESALGRQWSANLQAFMQRNFILPSRAAFLNRQDDGPIARSLEAAEHRLNVAAPALYQLASETSQQLAQRGLRKGNVEWMKHIFKAVDAAIKERDDGGMLMKTILQQAKQRVMPVDVDNLRAVCRRYGLLDGETDWAIIADSAQCDPDIFQGEGAGAELLKEVCKRTIEHQTPATNHKPISETVEAIARGFKTARDFSAFLKLWHSQLAEVEQQKLKASPWISVGRKGSSTESLPSWIEQELSMQQLVNVLSWVEQQGGSSKTLCLWLNIFTEGIHSNEAKDAVGQQIFDLIKKVKKTSSNTLALKWRVVSRAFAWAPLSQRAENWDEIKESLAKTLKKSSVESADTFEAFKCCSRLWTSLSPDGKQIQEVAQLVDGFSTRLAAEVVKSDAIDADFLPMLLTVGEGELEYQDSQPLRQYLAWYLRGATHLTRFYFEEDGKLPPPVQQVLMGSTAESQTMEAMWKSLLDNEHCVNDAKLAERLLDCVISSLEGAREQGTLLCEGSHYWMRLISSVPLDAINRQQRERIMASLMATVTTSDGAARTPLGPWKSLFSLATKLMSRPTFYEGLSFQHLLDTADAMSTTLIAMSASSEVLLEVTARFSQMASQTIRQMASHIEERSISYFEDASSFVVDFKALVAQDEFNGVAQPLRLTLLKVLSNELSQSPAVRNQDSLESIPTEAQLILGRCVASVMDEWVADKKLFSQPNTVADFRLLAAVDAADVGENVPEMQKQKTSSLRKLEKRSLEAMKDGDLRSWKMQTFLQKYLSSELEAPRPASFHALPNIQGWGGESILREYVGAIVQDMDEVLKMMYLESLMGEFQAGCNSDGQLVAIQFVVGQLIESPDTLHNTGEFDLANATTELTRALNDSTNTTNAVYICRTLYNLLERKPQVINQSNVESLLSTIAVLSAKKPEVKSAVPFIWLCKLVEVIIKKHRLRLEGHYHILLAALQPLLRHLILTQRNGGSNDGLSHESKATAFGRLITLMCEPTAGSVARSQHHSTLDSATDEAKRTAGRHMYLVLMQYVKLQLETDISRGLREALEPAMNSIFDITPPEGRKLLNDAMDASGRAILREMFKRYTKFGKWSGV